MLEAELIRYHLGVQATLGILKFNVTHAPIYTLEKPWLGNMNMVSCIPEGTYIVKPYTSEQHPDVYEITGVNYRTKILFHVGNYSTDTKGCALIGHGVDPTTPMVSRSEKAMETMRRLVGKENFKLTVRNLL